MNQLENKIALVLGGTSGIGRATAILFAQEGAKVVISGRRTVQGEAVVNEIKAAGGDAAFIQVDVTNEFDVQNAVNQTVELYGRLDVLFNNAGTEGQFGAPVHESANQTYHEVFNINVRGLFWAQKYATQAMLATGGGSIINTSSIAGHIGFPTAAVYAASKHAVEGFTKTAALELAKIGIRVNAVAPGAIRTEMFERALSAAEDYVVSMHPIGRIGRPEEVAEAVLFLASDRASFITGVSLPVDGGFTAA